MRPYFDKRKGALLMGRLGLPLTPEKSFIKNDLDFPLDQW
jgi:hypothetical protein